MSRLTIVMNGKAYCNNPKCQGDCIKCYRFSTILQNLSYYEDLEEQGRLHILPCPLHSRIYKIDKYDGIIESVFNYIDIPHFGKTVFLTKEEAEAKLKELREGAE